MSSYQFPDRDDFEDALAIFSRQGPRLPETEPIYWNKNQPIKCDEYYKTTIIWHDAPIDDPNTLHTFKDMFKKNFGLDHDIRWIGIINTFKTPGVPNTGGRPDAAFLVHENDIPKISNETRLDCGFRWWFDVVGNGDIRLYPLHFRRNYE